MSIAPNMHSGWWPVIVIGYAALLFGTATIVNAIVNEPYMVGHLLYVFPPSALHNLTTMTELGRDLSYSTGTTVLQWRLFHLGSYDYHSSRTVSLWFQMITCFVQPPTDS
jgi:hypothetical protein